MVDWLIALGALIVVCHGTYQRHRWEGEPAHFEFHDAKQLQNRGKHLVVSLTGAFNGSEHTKKIVDQLSGDSDVLVLHHPLRLFDILRQVTRLYRRVCQLDTVEGQPGAKKYKTIVLLGFSLGGLMALLFAVMDYRNGRRFGGRLGVIGADSPLQAEHLLVPVLGTPIKGRLVAFARMLMSLRPGPVWNMIFAPIMRFAVFLPVPANEWGEGADRAHHRRHMAQLQRTPLSLFISQTAAIVRAKAMPRQAFVGVPAWYIMCEGKDIVIDAMAAFNGWKQYFPNLPCSRVKRSGHILCVEHPDEWGAAVAVAVAGLQRQLTLAA